MRTLMTLIAILILPAACAEGHDIYSGLMDRLGESSCCDDRDCRRAHYRITSAGVEMLLDDEWTRVPNDVIQYIAPSIRAKPTAATGAASRIGIRFRGSSVRQF